MSLNFFQQLTRVFGLLALGVMFAIIAFACLIEVKDLDLWLHVRMGEIITTSGHVPAKDVLSATINGRAWVNHEWLFQVVAYTVRAAFGFDGLLYMQAVMVILTFMVLLLWTYRGDRQLVILPLLFSVMQVYQTRFTVRPDLFSVMYFVLFVMILSTFMEKRWSLPVLIVVQVLWVNMHGYFFWGPVLAGLFLAAEAGRRHLPLPWAWREEGRLSDAGYHRLMAALALVILAGLANPLMFKGAVYPLKVLLQLSGGHKVFFKYITELQPPIVWAKFFDFGQQGPFKTLIIVSAISFILNIRRLNLGLLLAWLLVLAFALSALRNMVYFAVIAYVAVMFNTAALDLKAMLPVRFIREEFELLAGWLCKIALIAFFLSYGGEMAQNGYYDFNKFARKSEFLGIAQRTFPDGAVDFLIQNGFKGPIFNDFNSGAYLVGRASPAIKVFIDGRTELYGDKFFKFYRKIWDEGDEKALDEAVARYHLKGALIGGAYTRPGKNVLSLFNRKHGWKLVYFADDGLVYLRDIPENAALIRKFAIDLKTLPPFVSDIHRLGAAQVNPYRETARAAYLRDMGYPEQAIAQADAALLIAPAVLEAFKVKAEVYAGKNDHKRAFENYRLAILQKPGDPKLRRGMALAFVGLGEYERALEQAGRLEEDPKDPSGPYVRAKVCVKREQYQKAYDILKQQIFPLEEGLPEIVAIGGFCEDAGKLDWAAKIYTMALARDPDNAEVMKKLKDLEVKRRQSKRKEAP